jgi:hypothetical protein
MFAALRRIGLGNWRALTVEKSTKLPVWDQKFSF